MPPGAASRFQVERQVRRWAIQVHITMPDIVVLGSFERWNKALQTRVWRRGHWLDIVMLVGIYVAGSTAIRVVHDISQNIFTRDVQILQKKFVILTRPTQIARVQRISTTIRTLIPIFPTWYPVEIGSLSFPTMSGSWECQSVTISMPSV